MPTYDVNLQVRLRDVYASSEDVAAPNARALIAGWIGEHWPNGGFEVEPDEVLQTPADVLRAAATAVHAERLVAEGEADSAYDAGRAAGLEQAVALLHDLADEEEKPEPQPTAVEVSGDPFAAAHDAANGPTARWDFPT